MLVAVALCGPALIEGAEGTAAFKYEAKSRRDPFVPLITKRAKLSAGLENVQSLEDLDLEGIVWDPSGGSIAILNGIIVKEGDEIGNLKIKSIMSKKIALTINKLECEIELIESIEKGDTL